jgi:hypothetical protein
MSRSYGILWLFTNVFPIVFVFLPCRWYMVRLHLIHLTSCPKQQHSIDTRRYWLIVDLFVPLYFAVFIRCCKKMMAVVTPLEWAVVGREQGVREQGASVDKENKVRVTCRFFGYLIRRRIHVLSKRLPCTYVLLVRGNMVLIFWPRHNPCNDSTVIYSLGFYTHQTLG